MALLTRTARALLAALLCIAACATAAAGFDCGKARTEDEKAICGNPELSRLDDDMAAAFKAAVGLMSGDARRIIAFRKNQVAWVKERSRCGDTVACLKSEYASRIRWLRNPAHQYAGVWHASVAMLTFHVQKESGLIYVALWPDKKKSAEQQDMVFMTIDGKFLPARQNATGEDQIIIASPQFSRANAPLKSSCGEIRLSFGTATMMGLEAGAKCPLLKGSAGDFRPFTPLFVYEPSR